MTEKLPPHHAPMEPAVLAYAELYALVAIRESEAVRLLREARDYVVAERDRLHGLFDAYPSLHRKFRAEDELLNSIDAYLASLEEPIFDHRIDMAMREEGSGE
jgi:hypothetical protein